MICILKQDDSKVCLGIGKVHGRKQTALYVFRLDEKGARQYPLAYFRDNESEDEAADIISLMTNINPKDKVN